MREKLKVFAGNASKELAGKVCDSLSIGLGRAYVGRFADGEVRVEFEENVRDADVFIINSTNPPAENWFELLFLADAAHRSSAGRITLVIPYLGYNRQDRKNKPRVPVSAKAAIDILANSELGVRQVLLLDAHSEATLSAFDPVIVDHLYGSVVGVPYLSEKMSRRLVVASPDAGSTERARAYAGFLNLPNFVIFDKGRREANDIDGQRIKIIGNVKGKDVIFVDDMIDTAKTLVADAEAAKKKGARSIRVFATHAVLSAGAVERLDRSPIAEVIITDSIWHHFNELKTKRVKITVLSIDSLLGQAIRRIHEGESLSQLFLKAE